MPQRQADPVALPRTRRPGCRFGSADGRSPGSRVIASIYLPRTPWSQWLHRSRLAAYSCGGSPGLGLGRTGFPLRSHSGPSAPSRSPTLRAVSIDAPWLRCSRLRVPEVAVAERGHCHCPRSRRRFATGAREKAMAVAIQMILIRQLAGYLSVPLFLVDPEGDLLFYNEPAEVDPGPALRGDRRHAGRGLVEGLHPGRRPGTAGPARGAAADDQPHQAATGLQALRHPRA